jgi:RecB family exonuclease
VPVSASLLEGVKVCPTQWFLTREAGGASRAHQSANLGEMVHALAQRVATGEIELTGAPDVEAGVDLLMGHVDAVWDRLEFRTPWSRQREHDRVRAALGRFLRWHLANPRRLVGTEAGFDTVVELDGGQRVQLKGYADRVELDADGQVVVVDLKTGRTKPSTRSLETNVQLGLYQYAVDHGAVEALAPGAGAGGAELVQLGLTDGGETATVQGQDVQPEDGRARTELRGDLRRAAELLRSESFPAVTGSHCRDCRFVPVCPARSAGAVTRG